jgi:hypothetical protein
VTAHENEEAGMEEREQEKQEDTEVKLPEGAVEDLAPDEEDAEDVKGGFAANKKV